MNLIAVYLVVRLSRNPSSICDQFPIYHNLSTSNSKDSVFNFLLFCWLLHKNKSSILQIIRLDCDLFTGRRYGICKCIQAGKHTLIYSMEMSAERLGDRIIVGRFNMQPDQVFNNST